MCVCCVCVRVLFLTILSAVCPSSVVVVVKVAKEVAERRRAIKSKFGLDPDDLLLPHGPAYANNTGPFATPGQPPFQHPLVHAGEGMSHPAPPPHLSAVNASFSSFSSSLAPRLSYWYRSALSSLPLPAAWKQHKHGYSPLSSSITHHAGEHHLSQTATQQLQQTDASSSDVDMQALLKKV